MIRAMLLAVALGAGLAACGSTTPTQAPATVIPQGTDPTAAAGVETPTPTPDPTAVVPVTEPAATDAATPAPTASPTPEASPTHEASPDPTASPPPSTPPADDPAPWATRTSKRFAYRMSYPSDWAFKAGNRKYADSYYGFEGTAVFASRAKNNGLTLKRLSSALTRYLPDIAGVKHFKIEHNRPAHLGPLKARRIEFNYRYKGRRYWAVGYLAVKGGNYYWVDLETTARTDAADRALAARFAKTFRPR